MSKAGPEIAGEDREIIAFLYQADLAQVLREAQRLKSAGHGVRISYSRKVFIPLTRLCRDVCGYCTFARSPKAGEPAFLSPTEVLAIADAGRRAGCKEALFTLGDKPELRYQAARKELADLGQQSTLSYLAEMCALVFRETGLLPHVNAGVMTDADVADLRRVSVSQGLMLESSSARLTQRGMPHFGSPDKDPALRLETIAAAGRQRVPFTTGILIGIGETRQERIESLLALRELHRTYGHIQEVIIQNFRAKPTTRMAHAPEPSTADHLWTIAAARLLLGPDANIQVPPNLSGVEFPGLLAAGLNDWGGISPVTLDHVNPEAPWPEITRLADATRDAGMVLLERLAIYPEYARTAGHWVDESLGRAILRATDAEGYAREDDWAPGRADLLPPKHPAMLAKPYDHLDSIVRRAMTGDPLEHAEIVELFAARGSAVTEICSAADELRRAVNGNTVSYVVNRNINYTNVCTYRCGFCAFSKGRKHEALRGPAYDISLDEVTRRAREAWQRGATEVCMQGGIHPGYTGDTYLRLLRAVKEEVPGIHVHAFSPLEIWQGASTLKISADEFLKQLKGAGLGSLPGTAAEILDDRIRQVLCPDKLSTDQWLQVVGSAHRVGLRTTATIMFGHVDDARSWANHLVRIRALQQETGGITEFVPLPFVHMEAPIYHRGRARCGPTWRETLLMHAVARLSLHPVITNIQASWVKLGAHGAAACLNAGVNDLGGTLMNESISRAAGAEHGQELPPAEMELLIRQAGRIPRQRSTLYGPVGDDRRQSSFVADTLRPLVLTPAGKFAQMDAHSKGTS